MLVSHFHIQNISVEAKPSQERHELGRNAHRFRSILLKFPDFDGGMQEILDRFGL